MTAFLRDDSGQDLVEYALLVALIAIVCWFVVSTVGESVQSKFQTIADSLNAS